MGPREETCLVPALDLLRLFSPGCKWLASWIVGGWKPGADAENRNQSRRGVMGGPPYAPTTSEAGRHTGPHPWYHLGHMDPVTTEAGQTCRGTVGRRQCFPEMVDSRWHLAVFLLNCSCSNQRCHGLRRACGTSEGAGPSGDPVTRLKAQGDP